ncbi:MAG: hypothetical protein M1831_001714 [Alyxoria varia]|nr:MAG: hypothetical protein M1831_001714 [Alyxoria varia]
MSFGFSAGDFYALIKIFKDSAKVLSDAKGTDADAKDLVNVLREFQTTLEDIQRTISPDNTFNASSHNDPLQLSIDHGRGQTSKAHAFKKGYKKFKWGFTEKAEARELRPDLNDRMQLIQLRLKVDHQNAWRTVSQALLDEKKQILQQIQDIRGALAQMQTSLSTQLSRYIERTSRFQDILTRYLQKDQDI